MWLRGHETTLMACLACKRSEKPLEWIQSMRESTSGDCKWVGPIEAPTSEPPRNALAIGPLVLSPFWTSAQNPSFRISNISPVWAQRWSAQSAP